MQPSRKRMPTKLCVMVEAGFDQPGVPALETVARAVIPIFADKANKALVRSADVHGPSSPCRVSAVGAHGL